MRPEWPSAQEEVPPEGAAARPPVSSYNEWDPLEEVIVGVADGACVPPWHRVVEATIPDDRHDFFQAEAGRCFPAPTVDAARRELDGLARLLEREGVRVRRPEPRDHGRAFGAPGWSSTGLYSAMPRDLLLVVGDEVIECPLAWRSRYFESFAYRPLLKEYFAAGARWSAAPKPELTDSSYDEAGRFAVSEAEPVFDAADFIRCGRDIFGQLSHVTNAFGIAWLRRHLGPDYRVHVLAFDDPHPMHIDATLMPLAPGKLLVNPERVRAVPAMFADWEVMAAPAPTIPDAHPLYMTSKWISMNLLMLDPRRVVVEAEETPTIEALRRWGFEPIPCPFRHFGSLGGSFHCATLDVRRAGTLQSYFD